MARLGFSLSHDEIRRFKHSILHNSISSATNNNTACIEDPLQTGLPNLSPDAVANNSANAMHSADTTETATSIDVEGKLKVMPVGHFVADNVDHNIHTFDGNNTFHGMGIIIATGSFGVRLERVRRLDKPIKVSELCIGRGVCILPFENYGCAGVSTVKLETIRSLQKPIQSDVFTCLNVLWHIGGRISVSGHPRPNWSSHMQSICQGEYNGISTIEMLEIIDLNPSDDSCIYSTLLFVIDQAKSRLIATPSLMFDQP